MYAAATGLLFALIAWQTGCARQSATPKNIVLPSAEHVVISDVHGDTFTDVSGHKRHVLYVAYESSHDMSSVAALRTEARRIFALYLPQIINLEYDTCVVTPMQRTAGSQEGRPFYFSRQINGQWILAP